MGNPVVHFEVVGKDADALQDFYRHAFDWQIDPPFPGSPINYAIAHPHTGSAIDGGIGGSTDDCIKGHVTFYVGVPDIAAALDKIETLGGKRTMEPCTVPGGPTIALFADPEDHIIGLVQTP